MATVVWSEGKLNVFSAISKLTYDNFGFKDSVARKGNFSNKRKV